MRGFLRVGDDPLELSIIGKYSNAYNLGQSAIQQTAIEEADFHGL